MVMYNTDSLGGREKAQGEPRFSGDMARTWLHLAFLAFGGTTHIADCQLEHDTLWWVAI